jgi:hypothetical protein
VTGVTRFAAIVEGATLFARLSVAVGENVQPSVSLLKLLLF